MGRAQKYALMAHADTVRPDMHLSCKMTLVGTDVLRLEYVLVGAIGDVLIPEPEIPDRRDELWRHTCFEAFLRFERGYAEFNFSPSRKFAAYRFEGYREGMQPAHDLPAPDIYREQDDGRFALTAWVDLKSVLPIGLRRIGLSAVIEETDGTKSYWALAHAAGPPDFHNPDTFIAHLPAPND